MDVATEGSHSWDRETEQGVESLTLDRRLDDSFDCIVTRLARVDKFEYLVVACVVTIEATDVD